MSNAGAIESELNSPQIENAAPKVDDIKERNINQNTDSLTSTRLLSEANKGGNETETKTR